MKLSVLTAVRNAVSTSGLDALETCVASIAALDMEHEHIIQDGCSTDGTTAVLADLAKQYPTMKVYSEQDTGIYNALNRGAGKAQGDWLYVLGADDFVVKPERLAAALELGERTDATMVASPVGTSPDLRRQRLVSRNDVFSSVPYPHQGVLMRLEAFRRYQGFDEQYRLASDADLMRRMLFAGEKVVFSDLPYAYYSLSGRSTVDENVYDEVRSIIRRQHGLSEEEALRLTARKLLPLRVILRSLVHTSPQVRTSARYYLARAVANAFGCIGSNGALAFRN